MFVCVHAGGRASERVCAREHFFFRGRHEWMFVCALSLFLSLFHAFKLTSSAAPASMALKRRLPRLALMGIVICVRCKQECAPVASLCKEFANIARDAKYVNDM